MNFLSVFPIVCPTNLNSGTTPTRQIQQTHALQQLLTFIKYILRLIWITIATVKFFVIFMTLFYSIMLVNNANADTITGNWQDTTETSLNIEVGYDQDFPVMLADITYDRSDNIDLTILAQEFENETLIGIGDNQLNSLYLSSGSSLTYGFWRLYQTGCDDTECTARVEFHPRVSDIQDIYNQNTIFTGTLQISLLSDESQNIELEVNYQDSDALDNVITANWQNTTDTQYIQDVHYYQEYAVIIADVSYTKTASDDLHFVALEYEDSSVISEGDIWVAPEDYYLVGRGFTYGNWRIFKTGCGETQCTARAHYYPDPVRINRIFSQNMTVSQSLTISFAHDHSISVEISVEYRDADVNSYTISANWQDSTATDIDQEIDPGQELPVLSADISFARTNNTDLHLTANEYHNDVKTDTENHTITPENYYLVGRQITYGSWQVHKTGCTDTECTARAEFHPNVSSLQNLYNRKLKITESLIIGFAMNPSKFVKISVDYQDTEALAKSIMANWEGTTDTNIVQEVDYEEEFPVKSVNFVYPKTINNYLEVQAREFQNDVFVYMTEGEVTPDQNFINVGATRNGYWRVYLISCDEDECKARADFHPNGDELKAIFNQGRTMTEKLLVRLQVDSSETIEVSITYQDSDGRGFSIDANWQDTTDTHIRLDVDENPNFPIVSADITYTKSNYGNGLRIVAEEYKNNQLARVGNHGEEQGLYYTSGTDFVHGMWRVYKTGCNETECTARADFYPDASGINQMTGFGDQFSAALTIAFNWHHNNSVKISLDYYKSDIVRFQWHNGSPYHGVVEEIGGYHNYPVVSANLTYLNSSNNNLNVSSLEFENDLYKRSGTTWDQDGLYYISGEGLHYGLWRVHKTGCNDTECTARVDFHPDGEALDGLIGQNLTVTESITIRLARNLNIRTVLSVTYRDNHDIGYRWRKSSGGKIYAEGNNGPNAGAYEWQYLDLKVQGSSDISMSFSGHEIISGQERVNSTVEVSGTSKVIRQHFGEWYIASAESCGNFICYVIHFRPNRYRLNNSSHGLTSLNAIEVSVSSDGTVIDTETITTTIFGLPKLDFSWSNSTNSKFVTDGTSATLLTNNISSYNSFISGELTYFHNKNFDLEISAIEIRGSGNITPVVGTIGSRLILSGGIELETIGTNFQYGLLHYSSEVQGTADSNHESGLRRLYFGLINDQLDEISYEEFATLNFVVDLIHVENPTTPIVSETISLELRKEPVAVQLSSGTDGATTFTIDENEEIEVTIALDPAPNRYTNVALEATSAGEGSGFIGTFSENPVSVGSNGTATVTLSTNYVFSHDLNGQIDISVAENPAFASTSQPLSFVITNYANPTVSIESSAENGTIDEGDDIIFSLIASPAPRNDLEVPIEIIEDGEVLDFFDSNFSGTVTIGSNGRTDITMSTNIVKTHLIDGAVTATISPGENYLVDSDNGSLAIVIDNLVNSIISIETSSTSISEGNHFFFTLTADPLPVKPFLIDFTINDTGETTGYLGAVTIDSPVLMPLSGRIRASVSTLLDFPRTGNGEITISLREGRLYNSSTSADEIVVAVNKRETISVPEVSIEYLGEGSSVVEGSELRFRLTADPAPNDSILVKYEVNESGLGTGYYNGGMRPKLILIDPSGQVDFTIPTVNDLSNRGDGELTVSILDSDSYIISADNNESVVAITNIPIPAISITSDFDEQQIVEGESFNFTLTATPAPEVPIAVNLYTIDQNGNHFREFAVANPITIGTSGTLTVKAHTNLVQSEIAHGRIEIFIEAPQDNQYTVDSSHASIATVIKDSVIPGVSIAMVAPDSEIYEGRGFTFEITASPIPLDDITVNLSASDNGSGHFLGFPNSDSVIINESGRVEVTIAATNIDSTSTDDGQITIAILADDDNNYHVSESAGQIVVEILDSTPTISIESSVNKMSIIEGDSFSFTVTAFPLQPSIADPSIPDPVEVVFSGTDSGSGHLGQISTSSPVTISTFGPGKLSGSVEITVATNSVSENNLDGTIDITIGSGTGYQISTTDNSISVAVKDSTTSVVSITSQLNDEIITEGDGINFTLTATPAPEAPITVELSATDFGTDHLGSYSILNPQTNALVETEEITIGTSGSQIVFVATNIDSSQVQHGQIDFVVIGRADSNYVVSTSEYKISVKIKDIVEPIVSISSDSNGGFVDEGASFVFTLSATPSPLEPIAVIMSAQDTGTDHLESFSPYNNPVTIGTDGSTEVTVLTRAITTEVKHGQIDILIDDPNNDGFTVAPSLSDRSIRVLVRDMVVPEVSISTQTGSEGIEEGENFVVSLTSNPSPVIPIQVSLTAQDNGTGHFANLSAGNVVELPTSGSVEITVVTNDLVEQFGNGEVTVSLSDNSLPGYVIGSLDHVNVSVNEKFKPVVSISSQMNGQTIVEGNSFTFSIFAIPAPLSPIFVELTASDQGSNHFAGLSLQDPIEVGTNGRTDVIVLTNEITDSQQNGKINVSLSSSDQSDYVLTSQSDDTTIRVVVSDTALPVVSLVTTINDGVVNEGDNFSFFIRSTPAPMNPIMVQLTADDSGSGHFSGFNINPIEIGLDGEAEVTVSTNLVTESVAHGQIEISLVDEISEEFVVSSLPTERAFTINIKDSVAPVIAVSSPQSTTGVTEGQSFVVEFTANPVPLTPIEVMFFVNDGGTEHFRDLSATSPVTIGSTGTAEITVNTTIIAGIVEHGKVSIAVIESSDESYTIGNNGQLNVGIADQVVPEVSISTLPNNEPIIEGKRFSILLETTPHPLNFVDVTLIVDELGSEFFQEFSSENPARIGPNGTIEIEVITNVVQSNLDDGQLSISIGEDSDETYTVSSTENLVNVEIVNKVPEISITVRDEISSVVEGSSFDVVLTAFPPPTSPISVVLVAEDSGTGHLGELSTTNPVSIGTDGVASVTVDSNLNSDETNQGQIKLTILEGANYTVSEDEKLVSVQVRDENQPPLPVVAISSRRSTVQEGETAEFVFNVIPAPDSNIQVDLAVTVAGEINLWRVPQTVSIGGNDALSLNILNSPNLVETGSITVQILANSDYVSFDNVAVITVEPISSNDTSGEERISVADAVVSSILSAILPESQFGEEEENASTGQPIVSIRAVTDSIIEGGTAQFQLFASAPIVGKVNLDVSQQGNFLSEMPPVRITMNENQSVFVELETNNDSVAELDGAIQVSILEGEGYQVSSRQNTAIVNVIDSMDGELYRDKVMTGLNTVLPQMMHSINVDVYQNTNDRLRFNASDSKNMLRLGGANSFKDWLKVTGQLVNKQETLKQMLLNYSSFAFDLTAGLVPDRSITAWGSSQFQSLHSDSNTANDWTGELSSGYLGLDSNLTSNSLFGIGVAMNEGDFDYDFSSDEQFNILSTSNTISPYFGWKSLQSDSEFQATIGYGIGEILVNQSGMESEQLDSQHASIAVGGAFDLAKNLESMENLGIKLAAQGSVLYTQQKLLGQNIIIGDSEANSHQFDFAVTGTKEFETENGSTFSPYFSIGMYGEKVTENSVKGMDYESGFKLSIPTGFSIASSGYLLLDQYSHVHNWHLNSSIEYDHNLDQKGVMVRISPTYGSGDSLSSNNNLSQTNPLRIGDFKNFNTNRITTELGYGLDLLDGHVRFRPYNQFELTQMELNLFSVGGRVSLGTNFNVEIVGTRKIANGAMKQQQLNLSGGLTW